MVFELSPSKIVNRPKIRRRVTRYPHEVYILIKGFGNLSTRVSIAQITVKQYFKHHSWSESRRATAFVFSYNIGNVKFVNHITYQVDWVILRNSVKDIDRKKFRAIKWERFEKCLCHVEKFT